jgi:hypothetical protein
MQQQQQGVRAVLWKSAAVALALATATPALGSAARRQVRRLPHLHLCILPYFNYLASP